MLSVIIERSKFIVKNRFTFIFFMFNLFLTYFCCDGILYASVVFRLDLLTIHLKALSCVTFI